jgi:DNA repair protein RadC
MILPWPTNPVHPREIIGIAIRHRRQCPDRHAQSPEWAKCPSEAIIKVTRDLIRAGQLLKMELLDRIRLSGHA